MNRIDSVPDRCPLCAGDIRPGRTTITVELGFGVVVIRHVPAQVCAICGEGWLEDETARRIEQIVERARRERHEVDVLPYVP